MLDVTPWHHMLQAYVDDQGRVDYGRWQQVSSQDLDQWLATMTSMNYLALEREAAIAALINLYNALTIQQVLRHYPLRSIRPTILGIPNWLAFFRFFSRKLYTLNGQALSLNAIEHGLLRQHFQEPRIHFALVCASVGCPLLRPGAYRPEILASQLEEDADRFINNPSKVHYDARRQVLHCSKIFQWYRADFLTVATAIAAYINRYYRGESIPNAVTVAYVPYDWTLNQRMSS